MQWINRLLTILLEIIGVVLAGLAVLAALLAWRLSDSPLRLQALEPYLVQGLTELAQPYRVNVRKTSLTWAADHLSIGVSAEQIQVFSPNGVALASVPQIEVGLSIPALLIGRVAPSYIRLTGPQLHAYRLQDGSLRLSLFGSDQPAASPSGGEGEFMGRWFEALINPPAASSQLGALRRIYIRAAHLTMDDYQLGVFWRVPRADLFFSRDSEGMRGRLQLEAALGEARATIEGGLLYSARKGEMQFSLNLGHFNPAELASQAPAFAGLQQINLPFAGKVDGVWRRASGMDHLNFDLSAGEGQFQLSPRLQPLPVKLAQLKGAVDRSNRKVEINDFFIQFDGPRLSGAMLATRNGNNVDVKAEVEAEQMEAAQLAQYWPEFVAKGARRWVTENIRAGRVPKAQASVALSLPLENPQAVKVSSFAGDMKIEDATVHYFGELPAVTNAAGIARFNRGSFIIDVNDGRVGTLRIPTAKVQLLGLDDDTDRADISLTVNGPVREQMLLLDNAPLHYMQRLGLDAAKGEGKATTVARFLFPLFGNLPIEMVAISAASRMEQVALPKVVAGQDLTAATLDLALDGAGMRINGQGRLGGAPAEFGWSESFLSDVTPASEISFSGTMDEAARQSFRLSWPEVLGGVVAVKGNYSKNRGQPARLEAQLDLAKARLSLPWFAWSKPEGTAGEGKVVVMIDHKAVSSIPEFSISTAAARVSGTVDFADDSQWRKVNLARISVPGTSLKGSAARTPGQPGYVFNFSGNAADIRGIYEGDDSPSPMIATPTKPDDKPRELMPMDVTFDIRQVVTGEGRELNGAKGRVVRNTRGWSQLRIDGTLAGGEPVRIHVEPTATGKAIDISTTNAGGMLSTLRLMENISGGTLSVYGEGKGDKPTEAMADLRDFKYLNARTLQKIAEQADPKGAEQLARAEGLLFKRLKARIAYTEDTLQVRDGRMAGDLIGLTLQGKVDLLNSQLDLEGTLVPLYGVNSMVSGIPIIGWLLTGGEGGGVFAATYAVKGPLREPDTSVNPLAMLAPGFLRNILFLSGD